VLYPAELRAPAVPQGKSRAPGRGTGIAISFVPRLARVAPRVARHEPLNRALLAALGQARGRDDAFAAGDLEPVGIGRQARHRPAQIFGGAASTGGNRLALEQEPATVGLEVDLT